MPYSAYTMDPDAREAITLDWAPHLGEGETISSSSWPVQPSGVTVVGTPTNTSTTATITLENPGVGREYYFVNRVVTPLGRYDWNLKVASYEYSPIPQGPPYASMREAEAFHPPSEGNEALTIETVLYSASDMVARFAPRPNPTRQELTGAIDASQTTIPVPKIEDFRYSSVVQIDGEVIQYASKKGALTGVTTGAGTLEGAIRGRLATIPSSHNAGATVEDVDYSLKARRAELMVFAWLWDTRGYKPSRTGVIGSESYTIDPAQVKEIVKGAMGDYFTGGGRMKSASVTSAFPKTYQRSYRYPWIGNL